MKPVVTALAFAVILNSCKSGKTDKSSALPDGRYCYEYNLSFDTIRMSMDVHGNNFSGNMRYIFFEKDNSNGTLSGKIEGNRVIGVYKAESEGMPYESEILFQLDGGELYVGFGEMEDRNGKLYYKDTSDINFDTFALRPDDCL